MTQPSASNRLMSLDVFRGATIAAMMLVNNPGSWDAVYRPLDHAEWHGWTFTDLIFPFFIWIVGVAMPLSNARRLEQGQTRGQLLVHALRRSMILFALGLSLNSLSLLLDRSLWSDGLAGWWHQYVLNVRVPGVLQRIAICYLATACICLRTGVRGQLLAIGVLLVGYWLLMTLVPVPGFGRGVLAKEGNFAGYIDNLVLNGPRIGTHVWKTARTWDPEGIISTLPAIATCLFGVLTGQLLRSPISPEARTAWMFVVGNWLVFAGAVMNYWLPINKNLWTSSYSVFMAGLALNCFAICFWLVDVQGRRAWAKPFEIYGMNAIAVFMLAGISGRLLVAIPVTTEGRAISLKSFLYDHWFAPFANPDTAPCFGFLASPKNASLLWALMYVVLLYAVAYLMYRRKWFLKF